MRFTRIALAPIAALALVAAACGPDTAEAPVVVENAAVLHYAYQPGNSLSYEVTQGVSMTMEASGDAAVAGLTDTTMDMSTTSQIDYSFAEGPSPDLTEVTITTTLLGGGATMTTAGRTQTVPLSQLEGQVAGTMVLIVDPQGRLVEASMDGQALPTELLENMDSMLGQSVSQPQHIGPEFPEEPIGVGSTWTTEQTTNLFGLSITQRGNHAVVGEETVQGRTTLKIDSTITTEATRIDVMDLFEELVDSGMAAQSGMSPDELEMTRSMFRSMGIDMVVRLDDSRTDMTTWFDPADGIVVKSVLGGPMSMTMHMGGMPDVGDIEMVMDMFMDQSMELAG